MNGDRLSVLTPVSLPLLMELLMSSEGPGLMTSPNPSFFFFRDSVFNSVNTGLQEWFQTWPLYGGGDTSKVEQLPVFTTCDPWNPRGCWNGLQMLNKAHFHLEQVDCIWKDISVRFWTVLLNFSMDKTVPWFPPWRLRFSSLCILVKNTTVRKSPRLEWQPHFLLRHHSQQPVWLTASSECTPST